MKISGRKLHYQRLIRNITQEELGRRLGGIIKQNVSLWEKGKKAIPVKYYPKLEEIFGSAIFEAEAMPEAVSAESAAPPAAPDTIRNTPELREFIKDAMMARGILSAQELKRQIGYDSTHSIERLLSGKLNWFPDVLSAVFDGLGLHQDNAPISPAERELLAPEGIYNHGGMLIRPIPVVDWANAAGHIELLCGDEQAVLAHWDPVQTETVPAPMGTRRHTQAFRVTGQSMEPTILDGEIIFCEQRFTLEEIGNGKIVVVKFGDCAKYPDCIVCKRYRRIGEIILLTSDNPAGKEFEISAGDIAWIGSVSGKHCEF
ncbi:helix-turn-helix transcriptional regulator [Victivallis sp. Marseille-Q1083]|uniref:LexA family transcriptional regulator n=1 Tax=Victivallis sp. Marseille-Q1083 TaxID=2717288 RepID=UPI001589EF6F|nr:S24 family peptidase [Victivallis sp. Marseille-Q1083]